MNVVEHPNTTDNTMVDNVLNNKMKRRPDRFATTPQKCDEHTRPIIKAADSAPA